MADNYHGPTIQHHARALIIAALNPNLPSPLRETAREDAGARLEKWLQDAKDHEDDETIQVVADCLLGLSLW